MDARRLSPRFLALLLLAACAGRGGGGGFGAAEGEQNTDPSPPDARAPGRRRPPGSVPAPVETAREDVTPPLEAIRDTPGDGRELFDGDTRRPPLPS